MQRSEDLKFQAWGDRACFTQPLYHVERATYDVPTPSAVVGIAEAIHWHPGMHYRVTLIEVLKPIRHLSMRTNEVTCVSSKPFDVEKFRTQRNNVYLWDVHYVFTVHFELDGSAAHNIPANTDIFRRRLRKGQLHRTPYFGMLPYVCHVSEAPESYQTIEQGVDRPLGPLLYGRNYQKSPPEPMMFNARLVNGTVRIPPYQAVLAASQV